MNVYKGYISEEEAKLTIDISVNVTNGGTGVIKDGLVR